MINNNVLIIGGDRRLRVLNDILKSKGYDCSAENGDGERALRMIRDYKYIILPVPVCSPRGNIFSDNSDFILDSSELSDALTDKQIVFGGAFSKELSYLLDRKNIIYIDLNKNEDFLTYNAFLTAQGALYLLLQSTDRIIVGKKVLITGFGRVAKALAMLLSGCKTDVTVCARNENQLSLACCLGYRTLKLSEMQKPISEYDYIFNTVPENIFSADTVSALKADSVYFELASKPYGADRRLFESEEKKYIMANALPGRYVSFSAGEKITAIIEKHIRRSDNYDA